MALALTGLGLSGCSLWQKSEKNDAAVQADEGLRTAPTQAYNFDGQLYDVEIFDRSALYASQYSSGGNRFAGSEIEFYDPSAYYYYGYNDTGLRPLTVVNASDPRDAAFVKLNGDSDAVDWRNCERIHKGYLFWSDSDLRLDPGFEVCMRNKGYVLTSEAGFLSTPSLSAQTVGLRQSLPQNTYRYPSSAYFR